MRKKTTTPLFVYVLVKSPMCEEQLSTPTPPAPLSFLRSTPRRLCFTHAGWMTGTALRRRTRVNKKQKGNPNPKMEKRHVIKDVLCTRS